MRRLMRLRLLVLVTAILAAGCGGTRDVTVVHVASRAVTDQPGGAGKAGAAVDIFVTLDFRDDVGEIHVKPGDTVIAGQPLVDLDPAPLATNVQSLTNRLNSASAALLRTQADLALAQQKNPALVPGLQAQVQELNGQISLDQQLLAIAQGHQPTVTAPIGGVIAAVDVRPGQSAGPGTPLVEIVDYTRITVTANLPVSAQPEVSVGAPAALTFQDFPDVTIQGSVSDVSAGTSNGGTSFQVTVAAPNTPDKRIRPGLNAYARVIVHHQASLALPRAAILNLDLNPTVVVVAGQVAHLRQVRLGIDDGSYVEILSGVQVNDACVIVGNQAIDDGTPVRITKDEG